MITITEKNTEAERNENGSNQISLVKNRKAPSWTKGQDFESYCYQLKLWDEQTVVSPIQKYFELIDSLQMNKEIEGLAEFVARDVIEKVNTNSPNVIEEVITLLKDKLKKNSTVKNGRPGN